MTEPVQVDQPFQVRPIHLCLFSSGVMIISSIIMGYFPLSPLLCIEQPKLMLSMYILFVVGLSRHEIKNLTPAQYRSELLLFDPPIQVWIYLGVLIFWLIFALPHLWVNTGHVLATGKPFAVSVNVMRTEWMIQGVLSFIIWTRRWTAYEALNRLVINQALDDDHKRDCEHIQRDVTHTTPHLEEHELGDLLGPEPQVESPLNARAPRDKPSSKVPPKGVFLTVTPKLSGDDSREPVRGEYDTRFEPHQSELSAAELAEYNQGLNPLDELLDTESVELIASSYPMTRESSSLSDERPMMTQPTAENILLPDEHHTMMRGFAHSGDEESDIEAHGEPLEDVETSLGTSLGTDLGTGTDSGIDLEANATLVDIPPHSAQRHNRRADHVKRDASAPPQASYRRPRRPSKRVGRMSNLEDAKIKIDVQKIIDLDTPPTKNI